MSITPGDDQARSRFQNGLLIWLRAAAPQDGANGLRDMIAVTPVIPGTPPPDDFDSIVYSLISCPDSPSVKCLGRAVNATTPEVIAGNISSIRFSYLYDDGTTENKNPVDPATVRSVRVTITGQTAETSALSGGPKTRQITSIVKLRNKR